LGRIDSTGQTIYQVSLAVPQADRIIGEWKTAGWVDSVVVLTQNSLQYPYNKKLCPWTIDNYGPIWIPKAGEKIELTPQNIAVYTRVIAAYEGNKVEMKNGKMYINDAEASSYTFKMNYYWAMGDNRHHSADSRAWGFVPEDHIVGKPLFIWMSMKNGGLGNGIRWNRIFRRADTK
jgi:signal peptidase I